ncbi:MAG TPA: prenyltransferase [Anaerolineaceae bacterium]
MNLIRLSRPYELLIGVFLYGLGGGIANFLGYTIDWTVYWIGQASVTFLQLSSFYLKAYYDTPQPEETDSPVENKPDAPRKEFTGQLSRQVVLQSALVMMTVGAVLTVLLLWSGSIQPPAFLFLGFAFLLAFFYAVPPLRLVYSGYGELTTAILMANLVPGLAFLFQVGDLHRLVAMLTFPLTVLYLATLLARTLQKYGADVRYNRRTLMVRMGWQFGMNVHNILILVAFLMFGAAALLDLPWSLTWPALLSLPVGLYQMYLVSQMMRGGKPRWNLLNLTAMATFGLAVYLLNLALWTN